ncbi:MAG: FtsQ-type POTRA domain-containing protein [Spirochaetales bacterium]|nr:FtsQ-type POTRA domain-containing protein [Spirochaetales bacterium]
MSQAQEYNKEFNNHNIPFYDYSNTEHKLVNAAERAAKDDRHQKRRENTVKTFKIIIAVLLTVVILQIVYHLYFARNVVIDKIKVRTDQNFVMTNDDVLEMAGLKVSESYFAIEPEAIKKRLESYPQVASAVVEKRFPDTLLIDIKGRYPLAICLIEAGNRVIPAAVDSEGVVFQLGKSVIDLDLPVVSGIKFTEPRVGAVLPSSVIAFLESLNNLKVESSVYFNSISECRIIRKNDNDFDVLMYPRNYSIPVRIGNRISKDVFTYMLLVLDVVHQEGLEKDLSELDFRTDKVVYKVKGE